MPQRKESMTHEEYTAANQLRRYLDDNDIKVYEFSRHMNVPPANVYYWLKNNALCVIEAGRRKVILPREVAVQMA